MFFLIAILWNTAQAETDFSLPLSVDATQGNTALDQAKLHFLRANPETALTVQNPHALFLKKLAETINRIGPKGKITLATGDQSMVDALKGELNGPYATDIKVEGQASSCFQTFLPAFAQSMANQGLNRKDFLDGLKQNGVRNLDRQANELWSFLEEAHGKGPFKILGLRGHFSSGKTFLLKQVSIYTGSQSLPVLYLSMAHSNGPSPDVLRLKANLKAYDGNSPLLIMIDNMALMHSLIDQLEVLFDLEECIKRLGEKRESLKVVLVGVESTVHPFHWMSSAHPPLTDVSKMVYSMNLNNILAPIAFEAKTLSF